MMKGKSDTNAKAEGGEKDQFDPSIFMQQQIKHELLQAKTNENLHKICITGGPCAGKTTALAVLQSDLQ